MRALVVEDDPRIRRDLRAALGAAGFRVEDADDSREIPSASGPVPNAPSRIVPSRLHVPPV